MEPPSKSVCLIQVQLEGRDQPVNVEYTQGTSVQAVLERACRTLGIYESWNYALYSLLFKSWLCESHLLSSYPAEDTLVVRKKTPQYLELVHCEENPKKRSLSTTSPSLNVPPAKRRGIFNQKTCLKTRYHADTIYLSAILFTSDSKILITSGSRMFPTIEIIRDQRIFGNFETDSEEFSHAMRTSLDWATSTDFDKDDTASDTDSVHSVHSNSSANDHYNNNNNNNSNNDEYLGSEHDTIWARSFGQAVVKLKNELSLESLGTLYQHVIPMSMSKSKFLVTIQHIPQQFKDEIASDLIKNGTLKWKNFDETNSIYLKDKQPVWINYIEKWCSRQSNLSPGLYLGVLYTESTLQGIRVMVPKDRKQFIPLEKIRDDAQITPEEASWVKSLTYQSPDCFMDLVAACSEDSFHNTTKLGRFQSSFMDSYHKLQLDTNLTWESNDIYGEHTVDIYLDLQNNQMFTMMSELDDHVEGAILASTFSSENTSLSSPTSEKRKTAPAILAQQAQNLFPSLYSSSMEEEQEEQKDGIHGKDQTNSKDQTLLANIENMTVPLKPEDSVIDAEPNEPPINEPADLPPEQETAMEESIDTTEDFQEALSNVYDEDDDGNNDNDNTNKRDDQDEEEHVDTNSLIKTSDSTGAATSLSDEAIVTKDADTIATSYSNSSSSNSMKPFIRVILIVKPMRQPHQIRETYQSEFCVLYPFHLFDAMQHATFNACLYASSRRAMQILQASRVYFTQDLVRYLQRLDNFGEITEQNVEDYFFDPDDFQQLPEEVRKVQQALDIIRDEINSLRQQWNSVSWTMTVIEWDRQRTMQSYSFGSRPVHGSIGRLGASGGHSSRTASVYNLNTADIHNQYPTSDRTLRQSSDIANQIEFLRDVLLHSPDRAWRQIRTLGVQMPIVYPDGSASRPNIMNQTTTPSRVKIPIGPLLSSFFANSSAIVSAQSNTPSIVSSSSNDQGSRTRPRSSSVSSVTSTRSIKSTSAPTRKKSAGHRLMRTLGFGGGNRNQNGNEPSLPPPPPTPSEIPVSGINREKKVSKHKLSRKNTKSNTDDFVDINEILGQDKIERIIVPLNDDPKLVSRENLTTSTINVGREVTLSTLPPLSPLTPFIINSNSEHLVSVQDPPSGEGQSISIPMARHSRISTISTSDSVSDGSNRMSTASNDTTITADTIISEFSEPYTSQDKSGTAKTSIPEISINASSDVILVIEALKDIKGETFTITEESETETTISPNKTEMEINLIQDERSTETATQLVSKESTSETLGICLTDDQKTQETEDKGNLIFVEEPLAANFIVVEEKLSILNTPDLLMVGLNTVEDEISNMNGLENETRSNSMDQKDFRPQVVDVDEGSVLVTNISSKNFSKTIGVVGQELIDMFITEELKPAASKDQEEDLLPVVTKNYQFQEVIKSEESSDFKVNDSEQTLVKEIDQFQYEDSLKTLIAANYDTSTLSSPVMENDSFLLKSAASEDIHEELCFQLTTPQASSLMFEDPKLQTFTEELAGVTLAEELLRVTLAEELSRAANAAVAAFAAEFTMNPSSIGNTFEEVAIDNELEDNEFLEDKEIVKTFEEAAIDNELKDKEFLEDEEIVKTFEEAVIDKELKDKEFLEDREIVKTFEEAAIDNELKDKEFLEDKETASETDSVPEPIIMEDAKETTDLVAENSQSEKELVEAEVTFVDDLKETIDVVTDINQSINLSLAEIKEPISIVEVQLETKDLSKMKKEDTLNLDVDQEIEKYLNAISEDTKSIEVSEELKVKPNVEIKQSNAAGKKAKRVSTSEIKPLPSLIAEIKSMPKKVSEIIPIPAPKIAPELKYTLPTNTPVRSISSLNPRIRPTPNVIAGKNMSLKPLTLLEEFSRVSSLSDAPSSTRPTQTLLPSPPRSTEISPAHTPEPLSLAASNQSLRSTVSLNSEDLPPLPDSPMTMESSPPSSGASTPTYSSSSSSSLKSRKSRNSSKQSQSNGGPPIPPPTSKWHFRSTSSTGASGSTWTLRNSSIQSVSSTSASLSTSPSPIPLATNQTRPSKISLPSSQLNLSAYLQNQSKSAPATPSRSLTRNIPPPLPLPPVSARLNSPPPMDPISPQSGGGSKIPLPLSHSRSESQSSKISVSLPPSNSITHSRFTTNTKINFGTSKINPPPLPLPPASSRITPSPYILSQQTPRMNPPPLPLPPASTYLVKLRKHKAKQEEQQETKGQVLHPLPQKMQQEKEQGLELQRGLSNSEEILKEISVETMPSIVAKSKVTESLAGNDEEACLKIDQQEDSGDDDTLLVSNEQSTKRLIEPSYEIQQQERSLLKYTRARAKSLSEGLAKKQKQFKNKIYYGNLEGPNQNSSSASSINHGVLNMSNDSSINTIRRRGSTASDRVLNKRSNASVIPIFSKGPSAPTTPTSTYSFGFTMINGNFGNANASSRGEKPSSITEDQVMT
ncbi:hypothetical protein G9A89_008981 [Geosiphon pyriformis]|nr:hypothetical protein G9A89_008981 [Geosiphon pyriformis]